MSNYRVQKPRPAGSVYAAIVESFGQLDGGVTRAAELLDLSRPYVNAMGDADATGKDKANMSLQHAGVLSEAGATALAKWLAIKAGGIFIPCSDSICADAIQGAVANYSRESGEAIGAALDAAMQGANRDRAIRELTQAHAALGSLLGTLMAPNVTPMKGAA